ncbi:carbohydrate kinase [uncultured Sphaerochaeta sp.]|uniref:carbohydrate kinase family protein n=1 Tax=uncultured Sphaerochaeta sp. TaxID=886478 RepID=UPI002A0A4945|nr:carbohydrate kinase [uncultured Sphaerochaeta sp.]
MIGVIGEALIDFIAKGTLGPSVPYDSVVGGCALNTAVATSRQDSPVAYVGKISGDIFGQRMLNHLIESEVLFDPSLCAAPQPSLLAMASLDAEGKANYTFYTEGTAVASMTKAELLSALQEHTDLKVVHIGSVALALEPLSEVIISALQSYEPKPVIFLDPNVRPAVIPDMHVFRSRIEEAMDLASLVKISDEDLLLLYEGKDAKKMAQSLAKEKQAHIILTLGKQGSIWYTPEGESVSMEIIDLPVIDTVGAGDTFSGGLLSYLYERNCFGKDGDIPKLEKLSLDMIKDALLWATASSAITCSRRGCDPPRTKEIRSLLASL